MATTTTPFLGCKISLISKSEIRYEGILYTIDPKESTIALAKVRSYGTEDRPAERQVPPREEIFEYIIFRAGDIKDLIVDDPPASIAPGLADPAIIQAHSTSNTPGATFPSTTFPQMTTNPNISATSGQRSSGPAFTSGANALSSLTLTTGLKASNSIDSRSQNSTPTGTQQHRQSPHSDGVTQQSSAKQTPNKENQRRNTGERGQQYHQQQQQHYRRGSGQQNIHQNYSHQQNRRGSAQHSGGYRQNQNYSQPQQTGNRFGGSGGYNRQYNNYSGGRRPPMQLRPQQQRGQNRLTNRGPKESLKFDGEYDFDKAEQEFKEMEQKMTHLKLNNSSAEKEDKPSGVDPHPAPNESATNGDKEELESNDNFYDKTKSFFDCISCEAIEREKGNVQRIDWKAERKLNSETFGVPLSYRRYGRGRGGYNYRGYSGGYRSNRGQRGGGGGGGGDARNRMNGPQRNNRNNN